MSKLPLVALAMLISAGAPAQDVPAESAPTAEPTAAEKALAAIPGLYPRRDQPGVSEQAIALLDAGIAEEPNNIELRWQVARFHFWLADNASSSSTGSSHAKICWDHAEHIKTIAPQAVQGHYWAMACIGAYSEAVGIINAVREGLAPKFEENGLKAASIDPSHDSGGPLRGLGRYYDQLPWPLRDADKSLEYLERAVKAGPKHARNLYFMADLLVDEGDEEQARVYLERVLALPTSGNANPPDVRKYQPLARALLAEIDG